MASLSIEMLYGEASTFAFDMGIIKSVLSCYGHDGNADHSCCVWLNLGTCIGYTTPKCVANVYRYAWCSICNLFYR